MQNAPAAAPRRDLFLALAVAYLALPNVIFLLGWVRPVIGIPVALIVVGVAIWLLRPKLFAAPRPPLSQKNLFLVLMCAFLWTLLPGVGGALPQSNDYVKHNLLFHDLTTAAWPVTYPHDGGNNYLCYALGYYLVPTLGGKMLGPDIVPALTFGWTFAGLALFFYWAATLTASVLRTFLAILFFAATGIFWTLFKEHGLPGLVSTDGLNPVLLKDGLLFDYNDSFTRFNYQPQHALVGWLCVAVFYERLWVQKNPRGAVFIWTMCLLWSPLTCLGLLLLPLAALARTGWKNYFEPLNLLGGGALLAVTGVYLQGHAALPDTGFIWKFSNGAGWLPRYLLFLALHLTPLLFLWLVELKEKILGEWRPLLFVATVVLILLPLYKLGFASDLRLQASSSAILFFALAADRVFQSEKFSLRRPLCLLFLAAMGAGVVCPIARPVKNLLFNHIDYSYENIVQSVGWRSLPDMRDPGFDVAAQYLGRPDSPATRWLLRSTPILPP